MPARQGKIGEATVSGERDRSGKQWREARVDQKGQRPACRQRRARPSQEYAVGHPEAYNLHAVEPDPFVAKISDNLDLAAEGLDVLA